jgi:ectoine hydroxylase-related dioxygenase (phytanoyl-CoA dioxygenase family)
LFYVDDLTAENGATLIVPGSHRVQSSFEPPLDEPWTPVDLDKFPSRKQLIGKAGDLVVMDARALHTSARNNTARPRRLINLGLVHANSVKRIKTDHWPTAGPKIQATASARLRRLLGGDHGIGGVYGPKSIVPEGWVLG